jgi:hypothetical protein
VRTAFFSFSSVFSWTSGAEINVSALNRISVFTDELIFLKLPSSYKATDNSQADRMFLRKTGLHHLKIISMA